MRLNKKYILVTIFLIAAILRFWKLDQVPVSLFGDEQDVGYQAYSILHTGRDYYGDLMPLHFHSLAEWRTPLYLYSAVPTVALFGISPLGVRLPAAFFGILGVIAMYYFVKEISKNEWLGIAASFILAISPWHLQYSRAGFEVTQLIFFLLIGLFLFYKSLSDGKWLWLSSVCLLLMPWVYSTGKLFVPILLVILSVLYRKEILSIKKKYLLRTIVASLVIGLPMVYVTLFGGAAQRFNYISIFSDPTIGPEIGVSREIDAKARGALVIGQTPMLIDKFYHNKFTHWGNILFENYAEALSGNFLFKSGDPNPRHSIIGMGMFYRVDLILLLIGCVYFFTEFKDRRIKILLLLWILSGILPSAITREGGNHSTRLILILIPIVILVSYGLVFGLKNIFAKNYRFVVPSYLFVLLMLFISYQHIYWIHNPVESEQWWHYGWNQVVSYIKQNQDKYDKVFISTNGEPPWIFFAASYQYPPREWQLHIPTSDNNKVEIEGFGNIGYIDKFYFGSPDTDAGIYEYGKLLPDNSMYLAQADEVNVNLIIEPQRTPTDLNLLYSVAYPSGEPAFYIFSKKNE